MPKNQHRRKRRSAPRLHRAGPDLTPARRRGEPDLLADVRLGTPRYLVADRRRGIAETRDRYRPPS